ncbi:MAG: EVE domain-containing protein [Candidatus Obscuribacterales bacterium]|nr:EVE domain-containing protein [Candidatus Obscuribacterales bacterium]
MAKTNQYWLFKSEPNIYSIDDLERDKTSYWEGVRNYQARNLLRDTIRKGDLLFFYHSNSNPPGIAGIAQIEKEGYPDHTALDPQSKYYDKKSRKDLPTWYMVDIRFVEKFETLVGLPELKSARGLEEMMVTSRGARLSIQPVTEKEWQTVLKLAKKAVTG